MSDMSSFIASPWGAALAIAAMTLVTFLCRIGGVVLMSHVRITPRVERGLRALPGSIILATILPVALDNGWPAIVALGAAIAVMATTRIDLLGLAAGLGTLSIIRALL
ncbi:AzlD family protein [Microvirga solisilvae]|uniref:AzlD family protein n=1 Tax=Microvirga solisilvae TaxID=2919498 RepID=UPI001FAF9BCD|nr:AzlD domain-containing protein [Microvirga solisilvae]